MNKQILFITIILCLTTIVYAIPSETKLYHVTKTDVVGYIDRPTINVHGTEYESGQYAKLWLQLLNSTGNDVTDGVCYIDIYTPDNQEYLENAQMTNFNHGGIYYYDLLVPLIEGVYPVIAKCYYSMTNIQYFVSSYTINIGVYNAGSLINLNVQDLSILRLREATLSGVQRIDVQFNFSNLTTCTTVPESLLSSLSIYTYARFDSVNNDDITLSIYNFNSSTWENLSNKLLEGNTWHSVSNSISLNNITKSGYYNASSGGLLLRFIDTNLTDGGTSNLDLDQIYVGCNQLTTPTWQEIKGSSEMHVNPISTGLQLPFFVYTLCGDFNTESDSSACAEFTFGNYSGFTEPQGWIYENITFENNRQTNINSVFNYETPMGVDCSAFLDILEERNGGSTDIYDSVIFNSGTRGDNCIVTIPVIFNSSENSFNIILIYDNYMLWELNRANRLVGYYRQPIEEYCNALATINNITFNIPIITNLSEYESNKLLTGCYQTIDDLYYFDEAYTHALTVNITGSIIQDLITERFYYPELISHYNTVQSIMNNQIELFRIETICEKLVGIDVPTTDFLCAQIILPDEYFSSYEGWLLINDTFYNYLHSGINTKYIIETGKDIDCSAVLDILRVSETGIITDLYNESTFHGGLNANCLITVPIIFTPNETSFDILVKQENYVHWNILQMIDKINNVKNNTLDYCYNYLYDNNISYVIPINESVEYINDTQARFCIRAIDDLYWFDFFVTIHNELYNTTHYLYEDYSYYDELLYFYPFIMESNDLINTYRRNINQELTLTLLLEIDTTIWNHSSRTLTEYTNITTFINTSQIASDVWNNPERNLTYYPEQQDLTNYTRIDESINLMNQSIINYMSTILYNLINTTAFNVWNYNEKNLTYYPQQQDLTNYTLITDNIWTATGRYIHGVLI